LLPLRIDGLNVAGAKVTIDISNDGWHVAGLPDGIDLEPFARPPITATDTASRPLGPSVT
jgi:hypothetical protein